MPTTATPANRSDATFCESWNQESKRLLPPGSEAFNSNLRLCAILDRLITEHFLQTELGNLTPEVKHALIPSTSVGPLSIRSSASVGGETQYTISNQPGQINADFRFMFIARTDRPLVLAMHNIQVDFSTIPTVEMVQEALMGMVPAAV